MTFLGELWQEYRGFAKAMLAHGVVFVTLLAVLGGGGLYIHHMPISTELRWTAEYAHSIAYGFVLIGFLGSFTAYGILFAYHEVRRHYEELTIGGTEISTQRLQAKVQQEIDRVVGSLESRFPIEASVRLVPPGDEAMAYDAHVILFLDGVGVRVKNSAAWDAVGNYYFNKDRETAKKAYDAAVEIDPENPAPFTHRALLESSQFENVEAARRDYRTAIRLGEARRMRVPWAYVGNARLEGDDAAERRSLETAKRMFEELISTDRNDAWAHFGLAICHKRLGNIDAAMNANERAIALNPDLVAAHYNHACYNALIGRTEESVTHLRKMVSWVAPFVTVYGISRDQDLASVRNSEAFRAFLETFGIHPEGR